MVSILFEKPKKSSITTITVKGHAMYKNVGSDIICAYVSALFLNLVFVFDEIGDKCGSYQEDEEYVVWYEDRLCSNSSFKALLKAFELQVEQIVSEYPNNAKMVYLNE